MNVAGGSGAVRQEAGKRPTVIVSRGDTEGRKSKSEVACPSCDKKIPFDMVNDHLDACIVDQEDKAEVDCPGGCHKKLPLAMVNDHLDKCLAPQEAAVTKKLTLYNFVTL